MNIQLNGNSELIIYLGYEGEDESNEKLKFLKDKKLFSGKASEVYIMEYPGQSPVGFLGLGKIDELDSEKIKKALFKLGKTLNSSGYESFEINLSSINCCDSKSVLKSAAEGLIQSEYKWDKYITKKDNSSNSLKDAYLHFDASSEEDSELIEEMTNLMKGIDLTRDLVNEPAMYMYPETLAEAAKNELSPLGVKVTVFDKAKIEELGMKAFLAVSRGSSKEPRFIIMEYNGDPSTEKKMALVGKGLTYDSGGYCIKTPSGMATMHCDMGGAGAVIGAMKAVALNKLKKNVVGVIAACENMISGDAYKTGDIIGSMSGKTIEVDNTDAEGRITLADSLYYTASIIKPELIIDMATLTGACVIALGNVYTGAITNNQKLMDEILEISKSSGDKIWQLPSDDEFREMIKSDFADLKNTGSKGAGTSTAGMFLENFVEDIPWVHLDIAGTAYLSKESGYLPKGATGAPVRTLYAFVKEHVL